MTVYWRCTTSENFDYNKKFPYLSEPSQDLINTFKEQIVTFENPRNHDGYVPCTYVERSQGNILFILFGRVELIIKPNEELNELDFISCEDNQ
jgi:hypothetical protein